MGQGENSCDGIKGWGIERHGVMELRGGSLKSCCHVMYISHKSLSRVKRDRDLVFSFHSLVLSPFFLPACLNLFFFFFLAPQGTLMTTLEPNLKVSCGV